MTIRTRFAPSPTGHLHVGGVRTALFSYLYARRHAGAFILRIEDTDLERSSAESVAGILEGMAWLGLEADEGPIYQTHRFDRYGQVRDELLASGHAYHCYCTREELEERREQQKARKENPRYDGRCRDQTQPREGVEPVVRFRTPLDGTIVIDDLVQGRIEVANAELDDLIIARSDGTPTYNFTVVVDDIDMQVSHVIRGDDHINNTPRQINIMRALGWSEPAFAHVPMILGADGGRLSKRHGAVSVLDYRDQGYLPEALLNYLVRLGWSHGDQEIFSRDELIRLFDLKDINKSASTFDPDKLLWLNQQYIKTSDTDRLASLFRDHLLRTGVDVPAGLDLGLVVDVQRDRCSTFCEMADKSQFLFAAPDAYDAKAVRKFLNEQTDTVLRATVDALRELTDWTIENIDAGVQQIMASCGVKMGAVAQPIRIAVTGATVSPSIGDTLFLLGRDESVRRIEALLAWWAAQ